MKGKKDRDLEVEDGREFTSRTIVGGRPRRGRRIRLNIPAGIEKAIYRAAIDPDFRQELLENRNRAIESHGLKLTDVENRILENIPEGRLELIIDRIRPARHGKRMFMKSIATAVVTLATGTAAVSCEEDRGVESDIPSFDSVGDLADLPADIPDVTDIIDPDHPIDVVGDMSDVPPEVPLDVVDDEVDEADIEEDSEADATSDIEEED
jgi:hypothetical protein